MSRLSTKFKEFLCVTVLIMFAGCSANLYHKGMTAFDRGNYDEAITILKDVIAKKPGEAALWRQLGISYYRTDQLDMAINALKQATLLDPNDGTSVLYLGLSHEVMGNEAEAIDVYNVYLAANPDDEMSQRVRQRVKYLSDKKIQEEVKAVIQNENQIDAESIPSNAIGVLGFNAEKVDPQYAALGRGLAEMLTTDLSKVSELRVVERLRLNEIKKELELSQSELTDKQSAPRLGKLIGAATVVTGELDQPSKDELRASAGLISTSKGIAIYPEKVGGELQEFFAMEKKLLYNILDEMGYTPTESEKEQLNKLPTTSLLAFLAYSRGLNYADQGMYRMAEAEFEAAVREDPAFDEAASALQGVSGLGDYHGNVEPARDFESDVFDRAAAEPAGHITGYGLRATRDVIGFHVDKASVGEGDNPEVYPKVKGKITVTGSFDPDKP